MRNMDRTEIERRFRKVLKDQNRKHDGGNKFIGTQGISPYGNNGLNNNGIRVGGTGWQAFRSPCGGGTEL